jgi:hypothetical protein
MSTSPGPALYNATVGSLAVERLIWATRPLGLLALVLWILHPSTTQHTDPVHMALLGFLAGIFYGLVVYGKKLQNYIVKNSQNQRFKQNRVPEEYYWGNIAQTMFDNR